jgi:rhamnopyranosyl-N-acetylglucosaminyl-diphospho-decaprenol beta-1,3/1,4-galactofuranosyltransferase
MMGDSSQSIAALVLAYSRFELLQQLIEALRSQTRPPDEIIVVYQGSSQDIDAWLSAQPDLHVVRQSNKGSAGGFCAGIEESLRRGHRWTWTFDDDAVPKLNALEELVRCPGFGGPDTAFLASRIVDRHGTTYMSPNAAEGNRWYGTVLRDRCVEVVNACWVGVLVSSDAVRRSGLPIPEFFLCEEDLEFTARLTRAGRAFCPVESVVVHFQDAVFDPFGKDFLKNAYYTRNRIARAKVEPGNVPTKVVRSLSRTACFLSLVATKKAPARTIPWIARGLFMFWPRIRYPS